MSIWWLIQSHAIGVIFAILHRNFPSEYYWYFSICKYCKSVSTEHRRTWFICAYAKHREPNTQLNAYRWKLMAPFENLVICHSVILCVHGEEKRAQLFTQYIHTHIWYRKIHSWYSRTNADRSTVDECWNLAMAYVDTTAHWRIEFGDIHHQVHSLSGARACSNMHSFIV